MARDGHVLVQTPLIVSILRCVNADENLMTVLGQHGIRRSFVRARRGDVGDVK